MKRAALPFGSRPVWPRAQVPEAELAAGAPVDPRAVGGTVVAQHPLDRDPVRDEERNRPAQEADGGLAALVGKDLGVGEAGVVVDRDVDELPACSWARRW